MQETPRLHLRPWTPADVSAFHAIWGDPQVIWWGAADDEDASRRILEKAWANCAGSPEGLGWFAVVERESGRICGNVFLQPHRYGAGWELGYHFAAWAQGRGYATEASRGLIDFAFSIGIDRVVALVLAANTPSQRVCEKLGLRKTGTLIHADLLHDVLETGPGRRGPYPIVFDLGGVVVRWDPEAILAQAVEDPNARAAVRTGLLRHPDWQALDRGTLAPKDAIERATRRTGLPAAPFARFLALVPDALAPVPEVIEFLEELHGDSHALCWLSNMHHAFMDHLERAHDFWSLF